MTEETNQVADSQDVGAILSEKQKDSTEPKLSDGERIVSELDEAKDKIISNSDNYEESDARQEATSNENKPWYKIALAKEKEIKRKLREHVNELERKLEAISGEPESYESQPDEGFNLEQEVENEIAKRDFSKRHEAFARMVPDYMERVAGAMEYFPIAPTAQPFILKSECAPEMLYLLYENPQAVEELNQLPPEQQAYSLGVIEANIKAASALARQAQHSNPAPAKRSKMVMPSNLAGARNVGTRTGPEWSGPPSLGDIFKR